MSKRAATAGAAGGSMSLLTAAILLIQAGWMIVPPGGAIRTEDLETAGADSLRARGFAVERGLVPAQFVWAEPGEGPEASSYELLCAVYPATNHATLDSSRWYVRAYDEGGRYGDWSTESRPVRLWMQDIRPPMEVPSPPPVGE